MNKRKKAVRNNLRVYRIQSGYTQVEVASILGFTNSVALSHWEKGVNVPGMENLLKLSLIYNTSIENLYSEVYYELWGNLPLGVKKNIHLNVGT